MFYSRQTIAALQPIVEQLWYCNLSIPFAQKTLTLPYGRIELVVNLRGHYTIQKKDEAFRGTHGWISGQQKGISLSTTSGHHECIGIVFTPLGWRQLSGMNASAIKNRFVSLSQIFRRFEEVFEQLKEDSTPTQKLFRIESYLQGLLREKDVSNNVMKNVLSYIDRNKEQKISVRELTTHIGLSRKSLNQHFQASIGFSATDYLQQRFFSRLLKELCTNKDKRLIEHTYEHHFFDQSHFIKQFQSYSGMTPGDYLAYVKAGSVDPLFPNFISL